MEFNAFVVVDNAVFSGGVSVPEWPPSTVVLWECAISGGGGKEMAMADTQFWCIRFCVNSVDLCQRVIELQSGLEAVCDEEKFVGGGRCGIVKGGWFGWWSE